MSDQLAGGTPATAKGGFIASAVKLVLGGAAGLVTGGIAVYSHAIFDQVVKPTKPVADFAIAGTEGLTVTCDSHATGDSGWWDFGDGTHLEPFDPAKPAVTHTYPKPATYSIKLVVRNLLLEEDTRTVAADLSNPPNPLPPAVTGLRVEAIRDQAPATYRISGDLRHADEVVWKLGDKAEHVSGQDGPFERYITFEKPGQYPILLTALSNTKKDPQILLQSVTVTAPTAATYEARVSITDTATGTEKTSRIAQVIAPVQGKGGLTRGVDRVIHATPGRTITGARFDSSQVPSVVKNPRVEVAHDGLTAKVTGDWAGGQDVVAKAAGGSDVAIPVLLTEERAANPASHHHGLSGVMDPQTSKITIRLPQRAQSLLNGTRRIEVDVGLTQPTAPRISIAKGVLDESGKWSAPVTVGGQSYVARASLANGVVEVLFAKP
jgi:PKD repeat protein